PRVRIGAGVFDPALRSPRRVWADEYIVPWRSGMSAPPDALKTREAITGEHAILVELLAVDFNVAAVSQVADHVPVQAGLVVVAGFRVTRAQGEVDRPADLFVEECIAA